VTLRIVFFKWIGFFCFFFIAARILAQSSRFERLGTADGMSQGMVNNILQDRKGLIWFATRDGLNRFDGYRFKVYQADPFNPFALRDNVIICALEDKKGRIWIGTETQGLCIFDPEADKFYHLGVGPKGLASHKVLSLAQTLEGNIWVGTDDGAYEIKFPREMPKISPDLSGHLRIMHFQWDQEMDFVNGSKPNLVSKLAIDQAGNVFSASPQRVIAYNPKSKQLTHYFKTGLNEAFGDCPSCSMIHSTPDGSTWIAQPHKLCWVRPGANNKIDVPLPPGKAHNYFTSLTSDHEGNLYIWENYILVKLPVEAYANGRIPKVEDFRILSKDLPGGHDLGAMLVDRNGLLWMSTRGYGVLKYNPNQDQFEHFLPGASLRSLHISSDHKVYAWNVYGGILIQDLRSGEKRQLKVPAQPFSPYSYLVLPNAEHWVLARKDNEDVNHIYLYKVNSNTSALESEHKIDIDAGEFSELVYHQGYIWFTTPLSVLVRFDPKSKQKKIWPYDHLTGSKERANSLKFDQQGNFWIGSSHGLIQGTPLQTKDNYQLQLYKNKPTDRRSLANNTVLSTLRDPFEPKRYLWVGTKGGGLQRLDLYKGHFDQRYTTADGLVDNVVYGILNDDFGNLWLSSNRGLTQFNLETKHAQNYTEADGLQSDEFNTLSYKKGPDGRLFFGGVNGLSVFDPKDLQAPKKSPPVVITGLKVQNKSLHQWGGKLEKSLDETGVLKLEYDQNHLTFEFSAADFVAPKRNKYRYRLVGANDKWTDAATENAAVYANLRAGEYRFEVLTGGSRGVWNGEPATIKIEILPPWWLSFWAFILYGMGLVTAIFYVYQNQVRRLQLQSNLDFEKREALRLAEMNALKSSFFSSVTHEFRTPLTLILEPVRQILDENEHAGLHNRLKLVENNAKRLLRHINQLLDISKVESGKMQLELQIGQVNHSIHQVIAEFEPLATKNGIHLHLIQESNLPDSHYDPGKFEQILQNLLSNAIKYTPNGGHITLQSNVIRKQSVEKNTALLQISVRDTGQGIAPEDLDRVFERYFQSKSPKHGAEGRGGSGTGIGLALVKELVELMGGEIKVESEVNQGAAFTFTLPVRFVEGKNVSSYQPESPSFQNGIANDHVLPTSSANTNGIEEHSSKTFIALLVEDNPELRQFIRESLPQNWQIIEANNGVEGLKHAIDFLPDVIVSDIMMPLMDGLEMTTQLKNDPRSSHIPVILLSAKSALESRLEGINRGADLYLTKPFHTQELISNMRNLVHIRAQLRILFAEKSSLMPLQDSIAAVYDQEDKAFFDRLISVMEENLDNSELSPEKIAHAMYMSRAQLYRKVNALTNLSIGDFLRNYRLDRAHGMLKKQEGNIQEISARTGFASSKHFSRLFKERFKVTPSSLIV
jgi:signal transduction histidine kinase/ligand-binding sensor domain-containing protein/DNA-binding response OmpR family regulator